MNRSTHTPGLALAAASLLGMTYMADVAFAQDCASPVTQADLGRCAHEEFLVATEAFAVSYKTLAESLAQKPRNQLRRM